LRYAAAHLCISGSLFPAFYTKHLNDTGNDGKTALHFAASAANLQAIDALLSCDDTRIDTRDVHNRTALHFAAGAPSPSAEASMLALLTKARTLADAPTITAFINFRDENGDSALLLAKRAGNDSVADLLVYFGARSDLKNAAGEDASLKKFAERL
jgi:ankyrin repeat protein